MWGVKTPEEAMQRLNEQRKEALLHMRNMGVDAPRNLEEQALLLIGKDIYEKLIKKMHRFACFHHSSSTRSLGV